MEAAITCFRTFPRRKELLQLTLDRAAEAALVFVAEGLEQL